MSFRRSIIRNGWLIVVLVMTSVMSGCLGKLEPQNRHYVMCLGIDAEENQYVFSFGFPDVSVIAGMDGSNPEPVRVIKARSLNEAILKLDASSSKITDFSQMPVVLFGVSLFENEDMTEKILQEIAFRKDIRRSAMVCVADGCAKDLLALDESVKGSIGVYLYELCQNNYRNKGMHVAVLQDMLGGRIRNDWEMPVFAVEDAYPVRVE